MFFTSCIPRVAERVRALNRGEEKDNEGKVNIYDFPGFEPRHQSITVEYLINMLNGYHASYFLKSLD